MLSGSWCSCTTQQQDKGSSTTVLLTAIYILMLSDKPRPLKQCLPQQGKANAHFINKANKEAGYDLFHSVLMPSLTRVMMRDLHGQPGPS
jgi:hypothetical protein